MRLYELAVRAASCDSLNQGLDREIQAGIRLQSASDSLLSLTTYQLVLAKASANMADQQIENQKALTTLEKKRKRKWAGLFFGALGLFAASIAVPN